MIIDAFVVEISFLTVDVVAQTASRAVFAETFLVQCICEISFRVLYADTLLDLNAAGMSFQDVYAGTLLVLHVTEKPFQAAWPLLVVSVAELAVSDASIAEFLPIHAIDSDLQVDKRIIRQLENSVEV